MTTPAVFSLIAGVQPYDWGKLGKSSKVAQYALHGAVHDFQLDENKPYAELWMGTHISLPSKVKSSSELLSDHLRSSPELIGEVVAQRFCGTGGSLPFLFKILSIQKALSIQSHPDKALAEKLHRERPDLYKDDNHKPEMAIALTDFRALCGFRPLQQIATFIISVPELAALIPPMIQAKFSTVANSPNPNGPVEKAALKDVWAALMTSDAQIVKSELVKLITRYRNSGATPDEEDLKDLVMTIESQFPGDVGVFCVFLLNVVDLKPGEAIFLGAGEPHAYISGDIVETMATSDNVLRAGLTPKVRDVTNLVASLTYQSSLCTQHYITPTKFSGAMSTMVYDPPIPEFSVLRTSLQANEDEVHRAVQGPSVAIVIQGGGAVNWPQGEVEVEQGSVFFVGAGHSLGIKARDGGLELYRAIVE